MNGPKIVCNMSVLVKNAIKKANSLIKGKGRMLVRKSGTEPKIRIMIEAPEIKVAKKYVADIEKLIESKS